ncbi:MAG: hypothetical protein Q3972_04830 [Corynebacterium sp.]|nr:hypothetical protein [Corynebacterium sp.]
MHNLGRIRSALAVVAVAATVAAQCPAVADPIPSIEADGVVNPAMVSHLGRTPTMQYLPELSSEFSSPLEADASFQSWNQLGPRQAYSNNNSWWLPAGYEQVDGKLRAKALRYCAPEGEVTAQTYVDSPVTTGVCPEGTQTIYSTTRMHLPYVPAKNFRMVIRAYFGASHDVPGLRRNFWFQGETKADHPLYTEFDLTEYYSSRTDMQFSASHLGRYGGHTYMPMRESAVEGGSFLNGWHTWTIEVIDNTVAYYVDDKLVGNEVVSVDQVERGRRDVKRRWDALFNQRFRLIHDLMVESPYSGWLAQPDNNLPWGEQWVDIDYIRTYTEPGTEFPADHHVPEDWKDPGDTIWGLPAWLVILLGVGAGIGLVAGLVYYLVSRHPGMLTSS